jgi:cytosine/adenosine deaminase-related metal-dependent hydrolase
MSPRSTSAEFRPALLIQGGIAVTVDSERRVEPLDLRLRDGRIVEIGRNLRPAGEALLDATGCAVLPGLVHAHVHLCQVLFRNQAEDRALLPWLRERIWPFEAAHTPSSLRASAELGIAELLLAGATCVLDMGTVHHHDAVFEAARELGIRLCSGKAMMDAGAGVPDGLRETTEDSLRESDRLAEKWNGAEDDRLRYAFAPRLALSCSPALLRAVASRLAGGARLHTHASENVEEIELVRARFGQDNVEMLGTFGLLTPRTTLAHGVHLSSREIELLAETGTSVAHCPSSNLKLASGIADVLSLLAAGVNVGLGADGAPCNNNLDLWREMKLAGLLPRLKYGPRTLTPMKILELATLGGGARDGLGRSDREPRGREARRYHPRRSAAPAPAAGGLRGRHCSGLCRPGCGCPNGARRWPCRRPRP